MSMTYLEMKNTLAEAEPLMVGRTALHFRDAGIDAFLLLLEAPEGDLPRLLRLLISVRPGTDRIHLSPRPSPKKKECSPTNFAARVNENLEDMRLEAVRLAGRDRVVKLVFNDASGQRLFLVVELIGRHANVLLLNAEEKIIQLVREFHGKSRCLKKDTAYAPLPPLKKVDPKSKIIRFKAEDGSTWKEAPLNGAADAFFLGREQEEEVSRLKQSLKKKIARQLKKEESKQEKLQEQLRNTEEAEKWKKMADLLQANFHRLKRGLTQIEVEDLFAPDGGMISIPLDPGKDPKTSVADCYRRYKKLKKSVHHLERRIQENHGVRSKLQTLLTQIQSAEKKEELEGVAAQLGLEPSGSPVRQKSNRKKSPFDGRRFLSSDGLMIWVGKDGPSNHRLTFQVARGRDMWLHCQGTSGSHVVVRVERNQSVPLNSLMEAALLAVHYSKLRGAEKAEVLYTHRKYVRSLRGAPPGKVSLDRFKILNVRKDPDRLSCLLNRAQDREAHDGV